MECTTSSFPLFLCPNSCHMELAGLALDDGEFGKLSRSAVWVSFLIPCVGLSIVIKRISPVLLVLCQFNIGGQGSVDTNV